MYKEKDRGKEPKLQNMEYIRGNGKMAKKMVKVLSNTKMVPNIKVIGLIIVSQERVNIQKKMEMFTKASLKMV